VPGSAQDPGRPPPCMVPKLIRTSFRSNWPVTWLRRPKTNAVITPTGQTGSPTHRRKRVHCCTDNASARAPNAPHGVAAPRSNLVAGAPPTTPAAHANEDAPSTRATGAVVAAHLQLLGLIRCRWREWRVVIGVHPLTVIEPHLQSARAAACFAGRAHHSAAIRRHCDTAFSTASIVLAVNDALWAVALAH